jgi:ribosome-associated translation inhibitor RaiA
LLQTIRKEAKEMRVENAEDHAIVQGQLQRIYRTINKVDDKLEKHLDQHREGISDEQQTVTRNQKRANG